MTNGHHRRAGELHVILGAGQVGSRLAENLVGRGQRVRVVRRAAHDEAQRDAERTGFELVRGDMTNLAFAERATAGASVVYDCMNPAYHKWPELLLPLGRGALHGATRAGARLVALDCLYMYGKPEGLLREDSPRRPCSKKGALRVELEELRLGADRRGDVPVAIGRASDFFGAALPFSCWNDRFFQRVFAGRAGECLGDPDMPHSYTFVDDIARALEILGARPEAPGQVWHLPSLPAESTRALGARLGRALGREVKIERLPGCAIRVAGWFSPFMREAREMAYQWEMPYVIDDSRFRTTFGMEASPVEEAVAATAVWARARFGRPGTDLAATARTYVSALVA